MPKSKWAINLAIFAGSIALAFILLALASIIIKALSAMPSTTGIHIPLWLEATAKATPINGMALSATAAATVAALLAAAHKFGLFRESEPHLTVTQTIHTQELGQSYRLVAVTSILHNKSRVLVSPTEAWCRLAQTSPLTDEEVKTIFAEALIERSDLLEEQFAWPILAQANKAWDPGEMTIEPNENSPVVFQFIIGKEATAVQTTTAIIRPGQSEKPGETANTPLHPLAWMCYTFYELPSQAEQKEG